MTSIGQMRMDRTSRLSRLLVAVGAGTVTASLAVAPAAAASAHHANRQRLSHDRLSRVTRSPRLPAGAHRTGRVPARSTVRGVVAVTPRDPGALTAAATAVSTPGSAEFRHYLQPGRFAARFGPSPSALTSVRSALEVDGLTVTSTSANGLLVHFQGQAQAVEAAFHTTLSSYRLANGRTGALSSDISLPSDTAANVTGVFGLSTLARAHAHPRHGSHPAAVAATTHHFAHAVGAPSACRNASEAATSNGGLTDDQIAHAYGANGLYAKGDRGAGQRIAVFELEPYSAKDLKAFNVCYFGTSRAEAMAKRQHVVSIDGGAGTGPGSGESILDVEDVSALAPDATLDVYEAPNTNTGSLDAYNSIVNDDKDKVVTTSWGFCEADEAQLTPGYQNVENQIFEQAALQGQSVFSASGDAGSDDCAYNNPLPVAPNLSTDDPSSQPFVVAVGGTTMTDSTTKPTEQVWNDGNLGGAGGGGPSAFFAAPSWQQRALSPAARAAAKAGYNDYGATKCAAAAAATPSECREVPDVSAQADEFTGAITVYAKEFGGWTTFGGTSSSAPLWAAMLADINASAACAGGPGVGFASPSLYAVAAQPNKASASFNDITRGNNDQFDQHDGRTWAALPGYDMATGLGTPRLADSKGSGGLAANLCMQAAATGTSRPSVTSLAPAVEPTTPTGTLTVTGNNLTGTSAVSIGTYAVPTAEWNVTSNTSLTIDAPPALFQTGQTGAQDGSGRAIVSVTNSAGQSSLPVAAASLLYVDQTQSAKHIPSVSGVSAYGGPQSGGNTVTVFGSGFSASGPDAVTSVKFGGVPATGVTVLSPTRLTAKPSAYSRSTNCATDTDPATDACQVQVVVSNANGSSHTKAIHKPYSGAMYFGVSSGVPEPDCLADNTCELTPTSTEYDYLAMPRIDSLSQPYLSEAGDSVVTISGQGFDVLGFGWLNVGNPNVAFNRDYAVLSISATSLQMAINGRDRPTTEPVSVSLTVQTLAGRSAPYAAKYAGIPVLTRVSPPAGPSTGGTHIKIEGRGFQGVSAPDGGALLYVATDNPAETLQQTGYLVEGDFAITAHTPQTNPGQYVLLACTVTSCSEPNSEKQFEASLFTFFTPGDPVVSSLSTHRGPAHGGTTVVLHGHNLTNVLAVHFGNRLAKLPNDEFSFGAPDPYRLVVKSPAGLPGTTVHVTVTTIESKYAGKPSKPTSNDRFTWVPSSPSAPRNLTVKFAGRTARAKWLAPSTNGGAKVLRYRITARVSESASIPGFPGLGGGGFVAAAQRVAAKSPNAIVITVPGSARRAVVRGLAGGYNYVIEVQAVNRYGRGIAAKSKSHLVRDPG